MALKPLRRKEVVDRNKSGKIDLKGYDPRLPYYAVFSVGNLDGSIEFGSSQTCEGVAHTEEEAIEIATNINDNYPTLECFVYHCKPIAKVWRGELRVTKLK